MYIHYRFVFVCVRNISCQKISEIYNDVPLMGAVKKYFAGICLVPYLRDSLKVLPIIFGLSFISFARRNTVLFRGILAIKTKCL